MPAGLVLCDLDWRRYQASTRIDQHVVCEIDTLQVASKGSYPDAEWQHRR
jgi:hypothetical protein